MSETVNNPDPDSFRPQNQRSRTQNPEQTRPEPRQLGFRRQGRQRVSIPGRLRRSDWSDSHVRRVTLSLLASLLSRHNRFNPTPGSRLDKLLDRRELGSFPRLRNCVFWFNCLRNRNLGRLQIGFVRALFQALSRFRGAPAPRQHLLPSPRQLLLRRWRLPADWRRRSRLAHWAFRVPPCASCPRIERAEQLAAHRRQAAAMPLEGRAAIHGRTVEPVGVLGHGRVERLVPGQHLLEPVDVLLDDRVERRPRFLRVAGPRRDQMPVRADWTPGRRATGRPGKTPTPAWHISGPARPRPGRRH